MLTIPRSQMKLFEQLAFERYQQSLTAHIREHFPGHAEYLGDQGVLRVIQHGCEIAEARGFESERDLCLYTDPVLPLRPLLPCRPTLPVGGGNLEEQRAAGWAGEEQAAA